MKIKNRETIKASRMVRAIVSVPAIATGLLLAFTLVSAVHAQTPNADFQQALAEYQQLPSDAAAEKVIKLAAAMEKSPPIPAEARRHFVMGQTMFKAARSQADSDQAADEFLQAARIAPWWPEARYNTAVALEAAGNFSGAISNLKIYQMFKLPETEAQSVQDKIWALEAKQKMAAKALADQRAAEAKAAEEARMQKAQAPEEFLKKLEGARFTGQPMEDGRIGARGPMCLVYFVIDSRVHAGWFRDLPVDYRTAQIFEMGWNDGSKALPIEGKRFLIPRASFEQRRDPIAATISDDGQIITAGEIVLRRVK